MDNKRGSALLSALFLMTLVAIAATAMSTHLQLDIYRARLFINSDKMNLASEFVEFWAMDVLSNKNTPLKRLDNHGKVLVLPSTLKNSYPDMVIEGEIYDLQSKFNLNNLQDPKYHAVFFNLLKNNLKTTQNSEIRFILDATVHWISPVKMDGKQAEWASYYSKENPPYLPANQPMQSVTEFRLVAGVSAPIYLAMQPFVTALPTTTSINLNTASAKVIRALGNGLTDTQLDAFMQLRDEKGVLEMKDIPEMIQKFNFSSLQVTTVSEYYLSVALVKSKELTQKRFALIHRAINRNGEPITNIVRTALGTF